MKINEILEAKHLPDLSKKSTDELDKMLIDADEALEYASENMPDGPEEDEAEELASHIEREIFKRANPREFERADTVRAQYYNKD